MNIGTNLHHVENIKIENKQTQPSAGKINTLPIELILLCLSYLDGRPHDQLSTLRVNQYWYSVSSHRISVEIKKKESLSINQWILFLGDNLSAEQYAPQITRLIDLPKLDIETMDLIQIKSSFLKSREAILEILKEVNGQDLDNLKELSKNEETPLPILFKNIFDLSKIYQAIDVAQENLSTTQKIETILLICSQLTEIAEFEKMIDLIGKLPYRDDCEEFFEQTIEIFSKIVGIFNNIRSKKYVEEITERLFLLTLLQLVQCNLVDNAIALVEAIPKTCYKTSKKKQSARKLLILELMKCDHVDKGIELAHTIVDNDDRERTLSQIAIELAKGDLPDRAIELVLLPRSSCTSGQRESS